MDFLSKNLAVFSQRFPEMTILIEKAESANYRVVSAKNGTPTLKVQQGDREVFVHSSYDPQLEARRWAAELEVQAGDLLIVFGFGLGYHLVELLPKIPATANVIVIEPNPVFLKLAFENADLTGMFSAENLHFAVGDNMSVLKRTFLKHVDLYRLDRVKTVAFLPVVRACSASFEPYQQAVYDQLLVQYANISTVLFFSYQWTKNFFYNLRDTLQSPGVAGLFNRLAGKPAVLVSAGPSLTKNMHLLKEAKGKAFILCVGSALRVLLNAGIVPDLVLTVDGSEANHKHFRELPDHRIPLVFEPLVHYGIVEEYPGPKIVTFCNDLVFQWTDYFVGEDKGCLKIGPSVANMSLDLLVKMGADPIIFIGQDLAYTHGTSHASGTSHAVRTLEDIKNQNKYLQVEGIDGEMVTTDRSLYTFLKWFESYINSHPDTTFVNATEGGARISGTRTMSFRAALDNYCRGEVDAQELISGVTDKNGELQEPCLEDVISKLKDFRTQMGKIKKSAQRGGSKANELAGLYKRRLPDMSRVNKILRSLDKVDRDIKENQQGLTIASLLFQPVLRALRQIGDQDFDGEGEREKGQRISAESILLYSGICRVAEVAEQFSDEAINRLKPDFPHLTEQSRTG